MKVSLLFCTVHDMQQKQLKNSEVNTIRIFITFRMSHRRREMYCGNARLCVCPWPHAHTIARTD